MSIYRHQGSRYWHFDFQIKGYRFSGSTACEDERDAQTFEDAQRVEAKRLIDAATASGTGPLTVEAACSRWWSEHGRHLNDPDIEARLDWIVAYFGPRKRMDAITDDDVSKLVAERRLDVRPSGRDDDGKRLTRPITARTVNKTTVSLLRRVMRRARDNWNATIIREPVWKKHFLAQTKRKVREITPGEETRLDAVEDADYAALREFAIITGLRRRALLLTWPQVDFDKAEVSYKAKGGVWKIVPLSKRAYQILWSRRDHHTEWVFTYVCLKSRTIPKGKQVRVKGQRYPITYTGLGSHHDSVWKKAGVDARIHDMRHTTGSRTLRKTGNLKVTSLLLGHSDIKITSDFYTHVLIEDIRDAMERTAEAQRNPEDRTEADARRKPRP